MHVEGQIVLSLIVNAATGAFPPAGALTVISSTAIEGSLPVPSPLLVQLIPILTFALLFAEAGSEIVIAVQNPCEPQPAPVAVFARAFNCAQAAPS